MKKQTSLLLPILSIILFACVIGPQTPSVATDPPTLEPTQADTSTPQPTETPVLPTATFTSTPTLVGYKTATPTPLVTETLTGLLFIPNTSLPPVKMEGFISVTASLNEIYKARGCVPSMVRITAQVANPTKAAYVLLFIRFKSLIAERASKWTVIEMTELGAGTYFHDLSSDQMLEDKYFETSWIEYQIVSTIKNGRELGRTDIFAERLKMLECKPGGTPGSP
ncbi:hypothetical protein MASR2M66_19640 [Chloroflexota bacterium]